MRSYFADSNADFHGSPTSSSSSNPNLVGPSAHWSTLRRHAQSEVLASQARNYILQMLNQDSPRR